MMVKVRFSMSNLLMLPVMVMYGFVCMLTSP